MAEGEHRGLGDGSGSIPPTIKLWGADMSGKLDWDRVRTENLSLAHGSAWITPEDSVVDSSGHLRSESNPKAKAPSARPLSDPVWKHKESMQEQAARLNAYIAKYQADLFIGEFRLRINPAEIRVSHKEEQLSRSRSKAVIRTILGRYASDSVIRSLRGRTAEEIEKTLKRFLPMKIRWRVVASNGKSWAGLRPETAGCMRGLLALESPEEASMRADE